MRREKFESILKTGFVFMTLCLMPLSALAQADSLSNKKATTDCEASLAIATGEFNAGRFFSLPSILNDCLVKGFTKEQRVRAYILLCQVYLINDNPKEAENSYLKLLEADPEYLATPEMDPIDVVFLSKKFTTQPVFTPHVKAGINAAFISLIHSQNPGSDSTSTSNTIKPGWQLGGGLDWNMSDRVGLSLDVLLSNYAFGKTTKNIFKNDYREEITRLTWLDLPLYLKYQHDAGRFRPYGYLGYGFHLRLSSKAQIKTVNVENSAGGGSQFPTEGTDVKLTDRQNFLNRSLVLGGGIKYKVGKNYIFADLRIQMGLTNVTNTSKNINISNEDLTKYGFISDLYRVNSINLTIGYIFPVYNPRMKGGWRPKGLIGKILYGNKVIAE
jgi:outer membrane protein W